MWRKIAFLFVAGIALCAGYYFLELNQVHHKDSLTLYGNVDVRQVDLGFRVLGKVKELLVEEGDRVEAGQLMAKLDADPYTDRVKESTAALRAARSTLLNTERILQRRKELISDGSISQEDLDNSIASHSVQAATVDQAEAALAIASSNLSYTDMTAPSDGIVLTRIREVGTVVNPADPVFTVSLTSPVWIRAYISEPLLGIVHPGMEASIYTDTFEGKVYNGKIGFISPVAEFTPKTVETKELRTDLVYRLRIYVDNPDQGLRQGMPVTVKLHLPSE